jgi:RHS repeat-associated protein
MPAYSNPLVNYNGGILLPCSSFDCAREFAAEYLGHPPDTAHRQDTAGGLYDFPAREYSIQGRWPSPDPAGIFSTCPKDPQTQNRYAYVRNNPITYVDPTGMDGACEDDPFCGDGCPWWDPFWCGGGNGNGGGGGLLPASGGEIPRPFPWPLLPPAFFPPLESNAGSGAVRLCYLIVGLIRRIGCEYGCVTFVPGDENSPYIGTLFFTCKPGSLKAGWLCPSVLFYEKGNPPASLCD